MLEEAGGSLRGSGIPPSPSSRPRAPPVAVWGDHDRARRQPLVHRVRAASGRDDQPDDPRHRRVPDPHRQLPVPIDHGGARRQPLVHRAPSQPDRDDQPDDPRDHRIPHPHGRPRRPNGITAGPDGNLWFTENAANQIGKINPATHAITEFPMPTPQAGPCWITAGPDGNLWFTETAASKVGDDQPDDPRHHRVPHPQQHRDPSDITAGPDGNLWFTETTGRSG